MREIPKAITTQAELQPYLQQLDHIDIKTVTSTVSLRSFVAGMLGYQPGWVTALYVVRGMFVRLLGMRQAGVPRPQRMTAATLPMTPGQRAAFFTVRAAQDEHYWLADADDQHLWAALAVIAEPLSGNTQRYHVVTLVRYRNWAGPLYFTAIRPFHRLVVGSMARAGARATLP
jgi:hypothetical protein